jgi:PST family polysaccharide transporter
MRWVNQVLGLASMLVLARILVPEDFGIVALAVAFVAVVEGITSLPTTQAIIRLRDPGPSVYDTAWTLAVIRGSAIALILIICAPWVAAALDEGRLEDVIFVLALKPLLSGLRNPRFIDFDKRLDFSKSFVLEIGTGIVTVAVTVITALLVRSYWAIVVGSVVGSAVHVSWTYVLRPHIPRFSTTEIRKIFGFSAWLSATGIVSTLNAQADKFLVAGFLNTASVGLYHMGTNVARSLVGSLTDPLVRALYPAFSSVAGDRSRLKEHVVESTSVLMAIVLPLGFGLALVSEELVQLLLGPRWSTTVPILHVLIPVFSLRSVTAATDPLVMAVGTTRLLFYRACVMIFARVSLVTLGLANWGLMGAVYGWALSSVLFLFLQLQLLRLTLGMPFFMPLLRAWRTWIALVLMSASVGLLAHVLDGSLPVTMAFAATIVGGGIVYCGAHLLLWRMAGRPTGAESRILSVVGNFWQVARRIVVKGRR